MPTKDPQQQARVGVVLNSALRGHYVSATGERVVNAMPAWCLPVLYEDHSLDELTGELARQRLHAVVVASGALESGTIRARMTDPEFVQVCRAAVAAGMGLLALHTELSSTDPKLDLSFLPDALAMTVHWQDSQPFGPDDVTLAPFAWLPEDEASLIGDTDTAKRQLLARGERGRTAWYNTRLQPHRQEAWEVLAHDRVRRRPMIFRSARSTATNVIVSAVPLDYNQHAALLRAYLARCVRSRSCIYVTEGRDRGAAEPYLQSVIDRGEFVHHDHVDDACEYRLDPTRKAFFFRRVVMSAERTLDELPRITEDAVYRRLENGVTVAGYVRGPGGRATLLELPRQPSYARVSALCAEWLADVLHRVTGNAYEMRAVATLARAMQHAHRDESAIPRIAAIPHLATIFRPVLAAQAKAFPEVHFLPTAAIASTCRLLGHDDLAGVAGRALPRMLHLPDAAELAQAMIWVDSLRRDPAAADELQRKRRREDDNGISRSEAARTLADIYFDALMLTRGDDTAAATRLARQITEPGHPAIVRAQIALTLASAREPTELKGPLTRAALDLESELRTLLARGGSPEAIGLLAAAVVTLQRDDPLGSDRRAAAAEPHTPPQERQSVALEQNLRTAALRAERDEMRGRIDQLNRQLAVEASAVRFGRGVAALLFATLLIAGGVAVIVASVLADDFQDFAPAFGVILVVWGAAVGFAARGLTRARLFPERLQRLLPVLLNETPRRGSG